MSSASVRFGTKAYVCARYFLRPGKCFKYIDQRGEEATEHVYEVMALYPYCVLLRDTRNGVRTCPGYNTLSLMLRGSEVNYDYESKSRPDWCPLKLLPEKKSTTAPVSNYEVQKNLFADGWNACLREITKTSDENER